MPKPLVVSIPHQLGAAEAKRRLETGIDEAKRQYAGKVAVIDSRWTGNHLDFAVTVLGQSVSGNLDVAEDHAVLSVQLPWALAIAAQAAQKFIRTKGQLLLEKK